ncbi:hypothetical protein SAMN05444365_103157 [Micromonospora pattaloongensis]|uniref:Periplasmic heavy metal sensor n=1 Tax=Micromonospora pattaloongensis TaxID=405436 RepID=A0A1H3LYT5_9ACTN|nr:hypothetical protein [Micromonospora pattaloongensis]SDY69570.1 hypothetical protein SAMN05444365_103157 [Micromonospora pattaloongensis]
MTRTARRGAAALIAATALSGALLAPAAPAAAAPRTSCTVTADQRAAALDQLKAGHNALRGRKPSAAERTAFRNAVAELIQAARDAKMSPEVRAAKIAELRALRAKLEAAATPEERTAIRAEIRAIVLELKTARLTKAERAELIKKIKEMRAALTGKLTKADRDAVKASITAAKAVLKCKVTA